MRLPTHRAGLSPKRLPTPKPLATDAKRPRLLIVDDEEHLLRALERELETTFRVAVAVSRDDAIAELTNEPIDVVLCDVQLLGESGLDVGAELAKGMGHNRIVYMSGGVLMGDARKVIDQMGDRFIAKPFELSDLITALLRALGDANTL